MFVHLSIGQVPIVLVLILLSMTQPSHQIESLLDHQRMIYLNGSTHRYLVHWKGLSEIDDTWIIEHDLREFSLEFLEEIERQPLNLVREILPSHSNVLRQHT